MEVKVISHEDNEKFERLVTEFKTAHIGVISRIEYKVTFINAPFKYGVLYTAFIEYN